jgi:hypothetical protein
LNISAHSCTCKKNGLTERQPHSLNPFFLQVHEWADMFKDFKASGYDFRVFVKGPGWKSDKVSTENNKHKPLAN